MDNPAGWPPELVEVTRRFITCEYATLARVGSPMTWPLNPYMGEDERTIDVTTGLSYPAKAERARRNPKVAILFSDPAGSGMDPAPVVLVQALATVRDADLQAGSDRYIRLNMARFPASYKGLPGFALKSMQWYFTRIWILNTPVKAWVWPGGNVDVPPEVAWIALKGTTAPPSDPAPTGPKPPPWNSPAADWHEGAAYVLKVHGPPVLTLVDRESGFPLPFRMKAATLSPDGFELDVPTGLPIRPEGQACLTFHSHPEVFIGQENTAFVGEVSQISPGRAAFKVARQLGDFSLGKTRPAVGLNMWRSGRRLNPYLKASSSGAASPCPWSTCPGSSIWVPLIPQPRPGRSLAPPLGAHERRVYNVLGHEPHLQLVGA